jgi:hypothetical protein
MGVSRCAAVRAARRRSIRAWRERWPECHRRRGAEGPATSTCMRWSVSSRHGENRCWPVRPPRVELGAVGDAHEVVVPSGLEVQAPEPDFESGWERVMEYLWTCTRCG